MSVSGSVSVSVADHAVRESEREQETETETERGTRRGGGTAGDVMMSYPARQMTAAAVVAFILAVRDGFGWFPVFR